MKNLLGPVHRIYGDLPVASAEISLSNDCVLKAYVPNLSEEVPDRRKAAAIVFTLASVYWNSSLTAEPGGNDMSPHTLTLVRDGGFGTQRRGIVVIGGIKDLGARPKEKRAPKLTSV